MVAATHVFVDCDRHCIAVLAGSHFVHLSPASQVLPPLQPDDAWQVPSDPKQKFAAHPVHVLPPEHVAQPISVGGAHVFPSADRQSVAAAHALHTLSAHPPAAHFALSVHAEQLRSELQ